MRVRMGMIERVWMRARVVRVEMIARVRVRVRMG